MSELAGFAGFKDTLRASVNSSRFIAMVASHLAQAKWGTRHMKSPSEKRRFLIDMSQRHARDVLKMMGARIEIKGLENVKADRNYLMVSNHMSYFDTVAVASVRPIVFVTSVDMGEVPVLGQMAELGGSIFIERRNRDRVERDLRALTEALKAGFDVMLYPEGTSTNGLKMLPFKKSLLMAAVEAEREILPVALSYQSMGGKPFGEETCDQVCWYGDMTFAPHFYGLMKIRDLRMRLEFLPPIAVSKESTRDELASKAFDAVSKAYYRSIGKA